MLSLQDRIFAAIALFLLCVLLDSLSQSHPLIAGGSAGIVFLGIGVLALRDTE